MNHGLQQFIVLQHSQLHDPEILLELVKGTFVKLSTAYPMLDFDEYLLSI